MANKKTVVIGAWDYPWNSDGAKGIHIFENGEKVKTILPDANVGSQTFNEETKVLYLTEEITNGVLGPGSGGYIIAIRMTDGKLLSRVKTDGCNTTMCALSNDGKYLVVAHHDGPSVDCADEKIGCPINLYKLNADGSIGVMVDRYIMKNEKKTQLHSIYSAPDKDFFLVADCGGDAIKTIKIVDEKIVETSKVVVEAGLNPRYCAFHPTLPIVYGNNERVPVLSTYSVDEDGKMEKISDTSLLVGDEPPTNNGIIPASDMVIHPNGKFIYAALRKVNRVVAVAIDDKGVPQVIQSADCGGAGTRGMRIDAAESLLYVSNKDSGTMTVLNISEDGKLSASDNSIELVNASNVTIVDGIAATEWPKPFRPGMPGAKK